MKTRLITLFLALVMLLGLCAVQVSAANPYLPMWERIPDGEPYLFTDPATGEQRVYIYGSHDSTATAQHCGRDHVVWSAPADDLTDWRWEGEVFNISQLDGLEYVNEDGEQVKLEILPEHVLYAPDVAYNPVTKKYYLYTFIFEAEPQNTLFVASSDSPAGPFTDPQFVTSSGFDPGVLVDTDNLDEEGYPTVYLFTGIVSQKGCRLSGKDMHTVIEGSTVSGGANGLIWGYFEQSEEKPSMDDYALFFEASSPRKIGDMYVMVYSGFDGGLFVNGTMNYAYSTDPMGPYTYGGTIVDCRGDTIEDPYHPGEEIFSYCNWGSNNHGGLVQIGDQWYIFYHRQTNPARSERQGMIEPVEIQISDGKVVIDEVEMTSQGAELDGLDPYESHDAGIACYIVSESSDNENPENTTRVWAHSGDVSDWDPASDVEAKAWNPIINIKNNTVIGYKYFNFGEGASPKNGEFYLELTLTEGAAGTVNVYANDPIEKYGDAEKPRTKIGTAALEGKESGVHTVRIDLDALSGKKGIYLEFLSESEDEICRLNALKFVCKPNAVFDDVQNEKSFYYTPVYWAFNADPQITNGTDATHFSPEASCTRGQVVTFLWRAAGCPEPKNAKTAFADLKPGAFYEKAVAWAVETNITKGTSGTTFSPDDTCTRGQIVTFLYRFKESPVVEKAKSPFTDLKPGAFYEDAVAWAVANKVTNGMTDTTFAPDATCTRGQVVTFLYRAVK